MRGIKTWTACAAFLGALLPISAQAHSLRLDPASIAVSEGATFGVNLVASDFDGDAGAPGSFLSAFDLTVSFDASRLDGLSVDFSDALGLDDDVLQSDSLTAGNWHLTAASLLPDAELVSRQGASVVLARLFFRARPLGSSEDKLLTAIDISALSELLGGCKTFVEDVCTEVQDDAGTGTSLSGTNVTISKRSTPVPVPGPLALMGALLLAFAGVRKIRS